MKYVDVKEVFAEIPDEITLALSISGCPVRCPGCHSKYLWADTGEELTTESLSTIVEGHFGITCLAFMGGDQDAAYVNQLARWMRLHHEDIRIAWYSGREEIAEGVETENFDYIKLGPYLEDRGGLNQRTTNQRLYRITDGRMEDITERFW